MTKSALGRGFEGLIPVRMSVDSIASPAETIKEIEISKIVGNPDQPRREFNQQALEELASSIKVHGIIQPLVVTPYESGYRVVAGERRLRASSLAGLKKVPVIIRNHKELEELEIALVENVQRVDLSPLEQAVSIIRLRDQFSMEVKDIAKKLGKAETTISNIIRLLQLPKEAIEALQKGTISEGHARAILSLKNDKKMQLELLEKILKNVWSVREAEEFVRRKKIDIEQKNSSINDTSKLVLEQLINRGEKIKIQEKKVGGTIIVSFKDAAQLEGYLRKLEG